MSFAGDEVRIIHSADFHLGARAGLGAKTAEHHGLLFEALERVSKLVAQAADVLLVVGDLLDQAPVSEHVAGALAARTTEAILGALQAAPSLHVVIIRGNHDREVAYDKGAWRELGSHERVRIVSEPQLVALDEVGINIVALPWMGGEPVQWRDWPAAEPTVVAAHCCYPQALTGPQDFVLTQQEVESWPVKYVALGHYHSGPTYRVGDRHVVYAGAPEVVNVSQEGKGRVVRVRVGRDGSANWEPVPIGSLTGLGSQEWRLEELPEPHLASLRQRLEALAGEKHWLRVRVTGRRSSFGPLDLYSVQQGLADKFFSLELIDETNPPIDVEALQAGEGEIVLKHFLRIAQEELAAAKANAERAKASGRQEEEDKARKSIEILREALERGYSVLRTSEERT